MAAWEESGWPALEARTGIRRSNIELNSSVWDSLLTTCSLRSQATVTFRPDVIVFSGGVMAQQSTCWTVFREIHSTTQWLSSVPDVRDHMTPAVAGNGSATG